MRLQGREISPTRASQLALRDEQNLIREGYEFLDEKRILLAQELLRQLHSFSALNERRRAAQKTAKAALVAATMRHGLEEATVYPPPLGTDLDTKVSQRNFLGVMLMEAEFTTQSSADDTAAQATFPSVEATRCAEAFRTLIEIDVARAAITTNLERLSREYVTTERRARALENVLLPEIGVAVKQIGEHLDVGEQEEALQIRHAKGRQVL
ncbi:V-type ATP synthase subunit D [Pseudomonadota bacterium]